MKRAQGRTCRQKGQYAYIYLPFQNFFPTLLFLLFQENRMKEAMSNNSTTSISQARKAVEQLKMEAYLDRIKVIVKK